MGFFTDFILPEPILRFTIAGISCPKDSFLIPWSSVCGYETNDDGSTVTITFWGGWELVCAGQQAFFRVDDDFSAPNLDREDACDFSKTADSFTEDDIQRGIKDISHSFDLILRLGQTLQETTFGQPVVASDMNQMSLNALVLADAIRIQKERGGNVDQHFEWLTALISNLAIACQGAALRDVSVAEGATKPEGDIFARLCKVMVRLAPIQKKYLWRHNSCLYGSVSDEAEFKEVFFNGACTLAKGLGRKILACSTSPVLAEKISEDVDMLVMMPKDIERYNSLVGSCDKLIFQPGHPQNGCTYVQHPFSSNVYYEVNSFHDSILERKQNELLRILESLGAYSAKVEIFHECQETSNTETGFHLDGNGSNGVISGSGLSTLTAGRSKEVLASQHATKDWQFNPPEKPELPQNLLFYPTEETWQQLATSVLRGGLKYAVVDLEYKTEYGITEKYLREVSASARAMIPSYEMNLKTNFASNLHRLTTTRWHYEVVFEDAKGKRAGGAPRSGSDNDGESNNKVEALFMKRARRYAQSDAHIDAEQRSDLEKFAQKYGIDDLRMEELIEEAFV